MDPVLVSLIDSSRMSSATLRFANAMPPLEHVPSHGNGGEEIEIR